MGVSVEVFASEAGASTNPAALVSPGLDASGRARGRLNAAAFSRALPLYEAVPDAVIARGAALIETEERDPRRFAAVEKQTFFEPRSFEPLDPAQVADWLGEAPGPAGLMVRDALVIDPSPVLAAWLGEQVRPARIERLEPRSAGWRMHLDRGEPLDADIVIVAAGWGGSALLPGLRLVPVRGQASWTDLPDPPRAASFSGYAIPTRQGVLFGSTHDRGDTGGEVRAEDHARNIASIAQVRPALAARIDPGRLSGRAAMRASTAGQMPVVGEVSPGLYVFGGLGSRGFTTAPLLAEHLAAVICGAPSPLPADLMSLVAAPRL
ncbi:MAG: FAD-dependent oxidoreductase [Hyphomicrobiales bacterium]